MHDEKKLHDTFIPHLYERIEKGELILFTGAGFCQGMPTTVGGTVPSSNELTKLLWRICYGQEDQDEASELKDLYEQALKTKPKELRRIFSEQFSIDPKQLPEWIMRYAQFPWCKAYTVNVDNFWETIANQKNLPRIPKSISAISSITGESDINLSQYLPAILLNGDFRDGPENVTFSPRQYGERTANPDQWLLQFAAEQLGRTIVYVGTALEEPDFWHYIELRGKKGPRGTGERRQRSYLVSPTLPRAKQANLASNFNIEWLQMTAEEFSETVLKELEPAIPKGLKSLEAREVSEHGTKRLPEVSDYLGEPDQDSLYLMGQEPNWPDIVHQRAADREEDNALLAAIKTESSRSGQKAPIIVTGTAGCGKSSTLMRVAHKLTTDGLSIGWVPRDLEVSPLDLQRIAADISAPRIICIEHGARYGRAIQSVVYNLSSTEPYPLVITELRSNVIDNLVDYVAFGKSKPIEIVSQPLEDQDIENILDILERESKLGKLTGKDRKDQISAFKEKAGRELLVAMFEATTGKRFKAIMVEEYDELEDIQKGLYGAASLATHDGFELSTDELFFCVDGPMNVVLDELETLKNRRLIVPSHNNPGYYRTRHRLIADEVTKQMRRLGDSTPIIKGLLLSAAVKVSPDTRRGTRPMRILQRFLNHQRLYAFGNLELAREVYAYLQNSLHWSLDYWLQRGLLELKCSGSLDMAEHYINNALGISDSHPLTRTEAAVLKMEKALRQPGGDEAPDQFNEGFNEILGIINEGRFRQSYPYHILGDKGLKWAKYGISDDKERTEFLRKLKDLVKTGAKNNSHDQVVTQIAEAVETAFLKQATTGSFDI